MGKTECWLRAENQRLENDNNRMRSQIQDIIDWIGELHRALDEGVEPPPLLTVIRPHQFLQTIKLKGDR